MVFKSSSRKEDKLKKGGERGRQGGILFSLGGSEQATASDIPLVGLP
jgi:hypothetical protein